MSKKLRFNYCCYFQLKKTCFLSGSLLILLTGVFAGTGKPTAFILNSYPYYTQAPSTADLSSDNNPSCFGSTITLTATITPNIATGSVEFFDGAASLGISTIASGIATISLSSLGAGSHSLTAVYSGDVNYTTSTSPVLTQSVNAAVPGTPGTIGGIVSQCPSLVEQIYSIATVTDAITYNWTLPTGWTLTGGAGTETISVTTGTTGQDGNITVTASNSCGTSAANSLSVTVGNAAPAMPGTITGTSPVCAGVSLTYNISAVTNATTYTWAVPAGWTINSGQGTISITVTSGATGGNITVTAGNSCGNSAAQTKAITVTPIPATPGTITGVSPVCPSVTGLHYSVGAVPGATSYTWVFPGGGWSITVGTGTNSVTVTSGTSSGNITVAAVNSCGSSAAAQIMNIIPVNATDNTGYTDGTTKSSDGIVTSTTATPVRRGYLKFPLASVPAGVTITASALKLTNNGTIGSSGSANQVRGLGANDPVSATATNIFNLAGSGTVYSNAVWSNSGQISLTLNAAANTDLTNSITSPGYISMGLVRGSGATIYNFYGYSAGANTPVLAVTFASISSFAVTVNPATPTTPLAITGATAVCPNSTGNAYSISAVSNATTYTWNVPAGWTISGGQGTISMTATAGNTGNNGNITVTAGNSCGTSTAQTLAVSVNASPTVSASPGSQPVCSGISITPIDITNPNGIPGTTFNWTRDKPALTGIATSGSGTPISGSLVNATGAAITTTFTITATGGGCPSVSPALVTVTVNPNPTANAGPDQFTCAATTTTIGGSPVASGGTPGYTYLWSAGVSNTTIANPTAGPGTYTVVVTDSKNCTGSDAVTVGISSGTKTWVGSGVVGGTGPDNNFNNPLNWNPVGVPGSCNDVVINVDIYNIFNVLGGSLTIPLANNVTIQSLSIDIGGTIVIGSATFFKLDVGSNSLNILNATSLNTHTSSFFAPPVGGYIAVGAGGVVTYGGTLTTAVSNNCIDYPLYANTNNSGKIYINGNANLGGIGNDPANKPSRIIFDGTGTQTISNNSGPQAIFLGATSTDIGETNSPTVVLTGAGTAGLKTIGDLNVNNTSTLDLGTTQSLNRNTGPAGAINLASGTFLKLGRNAGGVGTSNFPLNFSTYNFNATSTVDYNSAAAQAIVTAPLYGNLTVSNNGNKTIAANIIAQKNITIQGSATLIAGANTITLGGNWTNYAQGGFNEQTSTVDFNGTGAQSINTTGGEIFYSLKKSAAGTTTMLSDVAVQGGGTSSFTLSAGTFDAGTFSFNSGASSFNISAGLLKLARTGVTLLPEFGVTPYNLTGGTIELYGAGDQVLRGSRAYRNLTFSTSGIKTVSSAITSITGTILTQNSVTLDVSNNTMGGAGTDLTMTGTSLYKTAGTGTKPDAQGTYTLGTGTTVEFTNNALTTEDVRLTAPTYYNLVVSGSNVANASLGTGIKFQAGGSFTVKNGGLFKLGNSAGFSGALTTSVANTNNPLISLDDGSTVEYYGGPFGTNPQTITNLLPYYNLNFSGTSLKTAPAGTITVRGDLSNAGSGFAHSNGTLLMNGTTAQNYNSTGTTLTYYNVTIINPVNMNANGDLNIANLLSLGSSGKLNLAAGNITLKSGPTGTASVDKINIDNSIGYSGTGRFIVERYIPTGASHGKTWQFLSTPAFGKSVNATWQEGNAPLIVGTPGLGTTISSEKPGAVGRGYDFLTPAGPSIKTYKSLTNAWVGIDDGVTITDSVQLTNSRGYMLFVRGDRSIQTSSAPANLTTLRTTGKLYSPGTDAPVSSAVSSNMLESVGNPYASAIDFTNLTTTSTGIDSKFYVWDPLLPGTSGLGYGGYQLLSSSNGWMPVPGLTSNYPTGMPYSKIQSGQAFFVYSTPGGTVKFDESNKLGGSQLVYRQDNIPGRSFLRTYLFGQSGFIADGNVVAFDPGFANAFDADDAIKVQNTVENFGISNYNKLLALDARRPVTGTDTIFYNFNNLYTQPYVLKIAPENMETTPVAAFFVDRFTGIITQLSLTDSSTIGFSITNDAASSLPDRFYIVFKPLAPVPVTLVNIKAARIADGSVALIWKVQDEENVDHYELETSADGRSFTGLTSITPKSNNAAEISYDYTDLYALKAENFYRIRAISLDGNIHFSNIAKVAALQTNKAISVYPNPVTGHSIHIYFNNQQAGDYKIQLINKAGQVVYRDMITVSGITMKKTIGLNREINGGNYQLSITAPDGRKWIQELFIE